MYKEWYSTGAIRKIKHFVNYQPANGLDGEPAIQEWSPDRVLTRREYQYGYKFTSGPSGEPGITRWHSNGQLHIEAYFNTAHQMTKKYIYTDTGHRIGTSYFVNDKLHNTLRNEPATVYNGRKTWFIHGRISDEAESVRYYRLRHKLLFISIGLAAAGEAKAKGLGPKELGF